MKNKIENQTVVMIFIYHDKQNFEFKVINNNGVETPLKSLSTDRLQDINKSISAFCNTINSEIQRRKYE